MHFSKSKICSIISDVTMQYTREHGLLIIILLDCVSNTDIFMLCISSGLDSEQLAMLSKTIQSLVGGTVWGGTGTFRRCSLDGGSLSLKSGFEGLKPLLILVNSCLCGRRCDCSMSCFGCLLMLLLPLQMPLLEL